VHRLGKPPNTELLACKVDAGWELSMGGGSGRRREGAARVAEKLICNGGGISTGDKLPTTTRGGCDGDQGCGRPSRGGKDEMGRVFF
jgi:hypothetical protein